MVGGILQLVGLVALLCWACELANMGLTRVAERRSRDRIRERLIAHQEPAVCPWPMLATRHEPEVERLREKGAL